MAAKKDSAPKQNKKSSAGSKAAATRAANAEAERRQREIAGVLLIAAGVLLGIYMFVSASGVLGKWLSGVLFGLCGWIAYVLPVILIGLGVLSIQGSRRAGMRGSAWFAIVGVLSIITLNQIIYDAPFKTVRYMEYLNEAYRVGSVAHMGGGFIGGVLCYPIQMFGGNAFAYTLTISLIVVSVIAVTGLSLQDMSQKLSDRVADTARQAAEHALSERAEDKKLYTDSLAEPIKAVASAKGDRLPTFSADDDTQLDELSRHRKRKKKAKSVSEALDDALSFMPLEGELKKKPDRPIVSDAWDDFEPLDDVPLVMKPVEEKTAAPRRVLPDPVETEKLFGAQPAAPRQIKKAARVTDLPTTRAESPSAYVPPSYSLLDVPHTSISKNAESPAEKARQLVEALQSFGISTKVVNISVGPVLTRFELQPAPGVRVARITALSNDIALALAAPRVRIEAPIPGKSAVGIEIPNKDAATVVLRDIVESREFTAATSPITLALGKDISGKVITADLAKMPHMLIAGSTGSGKSVCINDLIISMVYKSSPADLRMILVDPKMVELSAFGTLPHLLIPVVTDPKKAASALRWTVNEMTKRYKLFSEAGARDLARYNELQKNHEERLPKIVVIIDELADLMMVAAVDVEDAICRIAQLGRAAGLHLIVATQRPSADVITGLIKANIPSRCAFAVSSSIDSRIILDATGAEKLLGRGDMLFHPNGANKPTRLQCAFVSDEEVERVVEHFRIQQRQPAFDDAVVEEMASAALGGATGGAFGEGKQEDDLMAEAVRIVIEAGQASTSLLQRRLRVGYARGSRLLDMMEQAGYVSPADGSKARRVLIKRSEYEQVFGIPLPPPDRQVSD